MHVTLMILTVMITTALICMQKARAKENTAKITLRLTGMDADQEPLKPTDALPDMSKLRLIQVHQYTADIVKSYSGLSNQDNINIHMVMTSIDYP